MICVRIIVNLYLVKKNCTDLKYVEAVYFKVTIIIRISYKLKIEKKKKIVYLINFYYLINLNNIFLIILKFIL